MVYVYQQGFNILVNEKPIKYYAYENKTFVEARSDNQYSLKLRNDASCKVLAVCSVDGINVISGDPATDESPGYILNGYSSIEIKGFRTSNEEVHPFVFSTKDNSYAAKSEQMDCNSTSCGVIGVKFFSEKCVPEISVTRTWSNWTGSINSTYWGNKYGNYFNTVGESNVQSNIQFLNSSVPSTMNVNLVDFDMGTKFSEKVVEDRVKESKFDKGELLNFQEIYYASKEVLEKLGIVFDKKPQVNFPTSFAPSKYCQPPKK